MPRRPTPVTVAGDDRRTTGGYLDGLPDGVRPLLDALVDSERRAVAAELRLEAHRETPALPEDAVEQLDSLSVSIDELRGIVAALGAERHELWNRVEHLAKAFEKLSGSSPYPKPKYYGRRRPWWRRLLHARSAPKRAQPAIWE